MPLAGTNDTSAAASTVSLDAHNEKPIRPKLANSRRGSWAEFSNEWETFNPAKAKDERLRFAEGDAGNSRFSRMYLWAINRNIIFRWALYIIPFLALLWIPGILGVTAYPEAKVWGVKLVSDLASNRPALTSSSGGRSGSLWCGVASGRPRPHS